MKINYENNLSETAFFCKSGESFDLRWFTPNREVKLCGHATLASAYVIFNLLDYKADKISFKSLSGMLYVEKSGDLIKMDLPSQKPIKCNIPELLEDGLGTKPEACYFNEDYIAVFENENELNDENHEVEEPEINPVEAIVASVDEEDYSTASDMFASELNNRLSAAIEQSRIDVASRMYDNE